MKLDYKGFTEKEIQDMIDWKQQCKEIDKTMWKIHAEEIIRKVIMDTFQNEPIGKASKSLEKIKEEIKKNGRVKRGKK